MSEIFADFDRLRSFAAMTWWQCPFCFSVRINEVRMPWHFTNDDPNIFSLGWPNKIILWCSPLWQPHIGVTDIALIRLGRHELTASRCLCWRYLRKNQCVRGVYNTVQRAHRNLWVGQTIQKNKKLWLKTHDNGPEAPDHNRVIGWYCTAWLLTSCHCFCSSLL